MVANPIPTPSAVHVLGPTSKVITGYLLRLLIRHFASEEYLSDKSLKDAIWRPETETTRLTSILIAAATRYDPTTANFRPAIIVKNNGVELASPQVIGDNVHAIQSLLLEQGLDPNVIATAGHRAQLHLIQGSHTVFCVSNNAGMAEDIGWEVFNELLTWQQAILDDTRLDYFRVKGMSEFNTLKENPQAFVVTVPVEYRYYRVDILRQEAPLLKRIITTPELV